MALYAYNKTGAPLALAAGHPIVTLPASPVPPNPGKPYNVTSELRPNLTVDPIHGKTGGMTAGEFALVQAQVAAGSIVFEWTSDPEYSTASLVVGGPTPGVHAIDGPDHSGSPVAALAGTNGTPSGTNKYVTDSDPRNSDDRDPLAHKDSHVIGADQLDDAVGGGVPVHGLMSALDKLKLDAHDNANDPTAGQKAALQGTASTPSVTNRYRSEQDPAVALITTANMQYYVDFNSGNDSWDGLSPVALPGNVGPKKTLQKVVDQVPYFVFHNVTINAVGIELTAGNIWIEKFVAKDRVFLIDGGQANRTVVVDNAGAKWSSDPTTTVSSLVRNGGAGFGSAQELKGYICRIFSSSAPGVVLQERMIHSHTDTALVPVRNYQTSPHVTGIPATFDVVKPSTAISANVAVTLRNEGVGIMQMQNIRTASTAKISQYGGNGTIFISHMVVESTAIGVPPGVGPTEPINGTGGWLYLDKSSYNPTTWVLKSAITDPQSGVGQVGAGLGWIYSKGSGLGMQLSGCVLKMVRVARTMSFHVYQGCNVESFAGIGGSYDTATPVTILNSSGFATTRFGGHPTKPSFLIMSTRVGISSGVAVLPSASPTYPHGIESISSDLRLYGVVGSGHAGLGVYAHCGGSIQLVPGNLATLTGALGDFGFDPVFATLKPSAAVPGSGLDTVLEARLRGAGGNAITLTTVAGGALALGNVGTAFTLTYVSGVTTVAQVEALINALLPLAVGSYFRIKTPGTGATVLTAPADTFGPINFTGGLNAVAAGSWSQLFSDYMFTSVYENVVAKQIPVTGV